ncbi:MULTISPECIES: hypothetical protein [unclassified Lysobacter]|uniref:hypothetical protein n=1 Tax=unclassified Lysobacter TaxID=2635362 RepID=UPI001BE88C91|nr:MULTISPECIES: hypothetical protein [unclassified Lysobacter]MBT2745439.1 hypothetical protein [Lysobacter sp. ISL-42]MBT2776981.1 hypothetical protein [Lysobacter sp. ISL-54]MBT2781501.1 hypothetical protein [Lysobacter sp. ISL-52]
MKTVVVILMILVLSSCDMLRGNKFEITNETGHELEDVQVSFANASAQRQSLGRGETFSFRPSPDRDGGIGVSYMENGKRVKHELGYVAPPISMRCEFQIASNGIRGDCQ